MSRQLDCPRRPRTPTRHWSLVPLLIADCWLLAAVAGCAHVPRPQPNPPPVQPLPAEIAAYYDYPTHTHDATMELVKTRRRFREFLVRYPLSVPAGFEPTELTVEFEWFESTAPGRRPAILFNPILGGDYPLERGICRYLAAQGFHVAMVHRKTLKVSPEKDASYLELLLRQGVIRIRQIVDWMATYERVDPQRMGSFGISMGGIAGTMTAAVEPRLRAHVIVLAGGSLPEILTTSKDSLLTKPRKRYLAHHHIDLPTMQKLLNDAVRTDPIRLAPYVDPDQVLMVIAVADRTIGQANALRLWRALGRPRAVFLPTGHYTAYFALPYLKLVGAHFLHTMLEPQDSLPAPANTPTRE